MTDLATLGIRVEGQEVATADAQLDGLAASAGKAETATERLAAAARGNGAAMMTMNTAVAQQSRVLTVARSSMGLTTAEGLNMGRQMSDVGVQLAMGMSPFMIAIQQGPQIFDVFQQAAIRTGTSVRVAMMATGTAVWAALAPLLPIIAAIGAAAAVMGGGIALATRGAREEIGDLTKGMGLTQDQMKRLKEEGISTTTTLGDVFRGTGTTIKEGFFGMFGEQIDWLGKKWDEAMDWLGRTAMGTVKMIAGGFTGAFYVVRDTWSMLPAALGDVSVSAANLSIRAVEWLVNKAIAGIKALSLAANPLLTTAKIATGQDLGLLKPISLTEMANPWAGAARQVGVQSGQSWATGFAQGAEGVDAAVDRLLSNIGASGRARVRAGAGDATAARGGSGGTDRIVRERLADIPDLPDLKPLHLMTQQIITPLELISTELRLIDDLTRDMASGLASAFGDTGQALGDLLTVMSGYESRLADINLAEQQHQLTAAQAARERGAAQMGAYGDMAAAARGFFKEGSDGYQAMLAVEQVYRAFQLGAAIQSMAIGGQETAMSVANSLAKGAASTAAGAAKMFEFLGPFAFPAVAAMLALLVGLGLSGSGGGGGGGGGRAAANDNADPNATTDRMRATNLRDINLRNNAASAVASQVEVRVTADRDGLNAYVAGVAQKEAVNVAAPMVAAAAGGAKKDIMQNLRNQQQGNRRAVV